jgi:hypothetical protein
MKKLNILVMPVYRDGSSFYRITQPYTEINAQKSATIVLPKHSELESKDFWESLKICDWIVVRMCHSDFVINWLDKYVPNKKIIIDLDDNIWDVNPYQDIYRWHGQQEVMHEGKYLWKDGENDFNIRRNKRRLARDEQLFRRANMITVSTKRLEKKLKEFNKNVFTVYNGLNFDNWKPYKMEKDEYFRIGWSGGSSHYVDLIEMKESMERLMDKHKNIKLVLAGAEFKGITKDMDKNRVELLPWVDIEAHPYRSALMNLDLAVIPLADIGFNKYKSCIKWYEFASLKVPTIASKVPPYSDEMSKKELSLNFVKDIEDIMVNKTRRKKMVDKSYKWVTKHRDIKKLSQRLYGYISKST